MLQCQIYTLADGRESNLGNKSQCDNYIPLEVILYVIYEHATCHIRVKFHIIIIAGTLQVPRLTPRSPSNPQYTDYNRAVLLSVKFDAVSFCCSQLRFHQSNEFALGCTLLEPPHSRCKLFYASQAPLH